MSVSVAGLVTLAAMTQPALAPEAKHTLLQYVTGKYLLPGNCKVNFEWEDPQTVGETMTFTVKVTSTTLLSLSLSLHIFLYFYIYIYIHTHTHSNSQFNELLQVKGCP